MEQTTTKDQVTLESWKEIAAYLQRDPKTARKWEKEEGLPVHRHNHSSRSSVYAYPSEIDRWRATRKTQPEACAPPRPLWKIPAFAVTMLLCLVMVGNGVRPQAAEAQQGQTRTLVCSGPGCDNGRISPDGKSLLILSNGSVTIRDLATKKERTLVNAQPGIRVCCPQFSPDGSRVAYSLTGPSPTTKEVVVTNLDGAKSRTVYRDGRVYAWSADGKRLLIGVNEPGKPASVTTLE